jgi:hypothetical protein
MRLLLKGLPHPTDNLCGIISFLNTDLYSYHPDVDTLQRRSAGILKIRFGQCHTFALEGSAQGNNIGKIIPSTGVIAVYPIATSNSAPVSICNGFDGNLCFAEDQGNKIGIVSPKTGAMTVITIPTQASGPNCITEGPNDGLWFTESKSNGIGKIEK